MKILIQNFDLNDFKFKIGNQEIKYMSINQLKEFLLKIPHDTSNKTIPIRIITYLLIIEKLDKENIRYEWNYFYTYRFTKRNKEYLISDLDKLLNNSKENSRKNIIDILIISVYSFVWCLLGIFNIRSIQNFLFLEETSNVINLFFLWLLAITSIGLLNYFIKNLFINLLLYRKKFKLEYTHTLYDDIKPIDITNLLFLISQYFYIIIIFYYFPNAYFRTPGEFLYYSLLFMGGILIFQEFCQTFKDLIFNFKKKRVYIQILSQLSNQRSAPLLNLQLISDLKNLNLIDQRLWKILITILVFLLSILPIL